MKTYFLAVFLKKSVYLTYRNWCQFYPFPLFHKCFFLAFAIQQGLKQLNRLFQVIKQNKRPQVEFQNKITKYFTLVLTYVYFMQTGNPQSQFRLREAIHKNVSLTAVIHTPDPPALSLTAIGYFSGAVIGLIGLMSTTDKIYKKKKIMWLLLSMKTGRNSWTLFDKYEVRGQIYKVK